MCVILFGFQIGVKVASPPSLLLCKCKHSFLFLRVLICGLLII